MTLKQFYLLCLLLPFLSLFLIGLPHYALTEECVYRESTKLYSCSGNGKLLTLFGLPLLFGGAQYIVFIVWLWMTRLKEMSIAEAKRLSIKLPFLFLPFCFGGLLLFTLFMIHDLSEIMVVTAIWFPAGFFTIIYGYAYVFLAHALYFLLRKAKLLKNGGLKK